jgi:DNA-binding NtrC family response regulator
MDTSEQGKQDKKSVATEFTHAHRRNCLVLDNVSILQKETRDELESLGWNVKNVQANTIPESCRNTTHVGLVFLNREDADTDSLWRFEELLCHRVIKWIAILPPDLPEHHDLWRMIGELFYDYHMMPIDLHRLVITMGHAHGMGILEKLLLDRRESDVGNDGILGNSAAISKLKANIKKIAPIEAPVLIEGESGAGKELAARAIVQASPRRDKPFITVNCGAIPPGLIQSELFGHEKGAFTSAHSRHIGHFEAANGGTIFLDEIGDLPMELQVVLLRALEEGEIRRVGGSKDIPVDVKIISATNVNLKQAVAKNAFREDLYFRLNVLNIKIPALRDRVDDIPLLSHYIINHFICNTPGTHSKILSKDALDVMSQHDWPGNVRELINRLQQAVVMTESNSIHPSDLGLERRLGKRIPMETLEHARERAEKRVLLSALAENKNISDAADSLGVSRVTIYRLLKKYNLEKDEDDKQKS